MNNAVHFQNNNQGNQKSPKIIKTSAGQQVPNATAKNLQKSEINHYTKKNTSIPQQTFGARVSGQLSQVESTQSIKTSPVKNDNIGPKQYPHSIQKTSINKAQKIKIGVHKKAASMMGGSQTFSQPPGLQQQQQLIQMDKSQKSYPRNVNGIATTSMNNKVQSYIPSSQNSFNDYNSTNNNYQEVKVFPKVDNLVINELAAQNIQYQQQHQQQTQQQLQLKSFQKKMHSDSQQNQQLFDPSMFNQDRQLQSFEQKSSNAVSSHQSQRLSIVSDSQHQQQQMINPSYRSHANSFKSSVTNNNIAMKHAPSKYVKGIGGGSAATTALGESQMNAANYLQGTQNLNNVADQGKKSLQFHHQRTFSDNQAAQNSRAQLFNANATGQVFNRKFQDLINSVNNNKEHLTDNFINLVGVNTTHNNTQDFYPTGLNTMGTSNIGNSGKGTKSSVESTRQSAQGQNLMDDKDLIKHFQGNIMINDNDDFSKHYNAAQFKDQFQKTKQALKMTQQQFGGPSRKAVQSRLNGSANTQSYKINTQQTLAGTSVLKTTFNTKDSKLTPKQNISKSSKQSYHQSQNVSAHGLRQSSNNYTNASQLNQQILQSEKIKKQKPLSSASSQHPNIYLSGNPMTTNITIGQVIGDINFNNIQQKPTNMIGTGGIQIISGSGTGHKRTLSDSNHVLLSLSNRSHIYQQSLDQYNQLMKTGAAVGFNNTNNLPSQHYSALNSQPDILKTRSYSKQQSLTKILNSQLAAQQPNVYQNLGSKNNQLVLISGNAPLSEYQVTSDRTQYNQSSTIQSQQNSNNNVVINSHRKISAENKNNLGLGIGKYKSDHVSIDDDKIGLKQTAAPKGKKITSKPNIKPQKSQKDIINPINQNQNGNGNNKLMMIIQDQDFFGNQVQMKQKANKNQRNSDKEENIQTPSKGASSGVDRKINSIHIQQNQLHQSQLRVVEERIETQESLATDTNLTPRSRMNFKIQKKIKFAFKKAQSQNINNQQLVQTSTEFYKIGKVMGKGAFGKVNLAIHRLANKFVALKSINKQFLSEESSKKKVMQEFNILRRTRHFNVVRLYESFETQQHIVFVMEVCGAGDLLTYVRRRRKLKEDVAKHIFKQIIEGLKYCHSNNILHRDIKLDNILLTSEGDIKICDFGVSKIVKPGEIMTEQCGTPAYIAPEVFENRGYEGYGSDVWSAGVVLYAMLYGTVPFKANNMTELQKQITKCQTTFKDEISPESINLLKGILERDPQKRMKITEILKHPWMQDIPSKVSVFTEQEKEKTIQEFAYYNFKNDKHDNDNGSAEIVHTDPFTEQMLNSTQNSLIKNASTKSVILAPFNSTRSNIDDNFHMRKSIQELLIDKKNVKFSAKVKEIDRQYEANNNAELDNGVYHQDSEEEKKEGDSPQKQNSKKNYNSIETSFDKDDSDEDDNNPDDGEDDDYGVHEMNGEPKKKKNKKQSEWQKIEQMVQRQRTEEEEEENQFNKTQYKNIIDAHLPMVINENIIQEIEKHGFPRSYIVNSLNNDELNYATTYYYLLSIQKEF